jgi:carbon-monoxide dehydrogenase large subunit/6-hydroxypseudooxynicotine dehydrogenase subunit gamma
MTGEAARRAAAKLRAKALAAAANLMQTPPEALDLVGGRVIRKDARSGPSMTLGEVARALNPGSKLLGDARPGLTAEGWFESTHMNYPYGIHFAVVRIDCDTGAVAVERYFVAYDIGKAVNPMLVEGQIAGGVAQGLGGALLEDFLYDDAGNPLTTTFLDYLLPTATDVPTIEFGHIETPAATPGHYKGVGEGGAIGAPAAVANAVNDALALVGAHLGEAPFTPARIVAALQEADR